jgi:hypothetical protein
MKKIVLYSIFFLLGSNFLMAQNIKMVEDSLARLSPSEDLIIFVNGFWGKQKFSPSPVGLEGYWQFDSIFFKPKNTWNYNQRQCQTFFDTAFVFFKTTKILFVDGGDFAPTISARKRQRSGYQFARNQLDSILQKYNLTDSSKIHFVTHSMGGAYSEGMIQYFLESKKVNIGKVVHLSISEASDIQTFKTKNGPELRYQFISQNDKTIEKVNRFHGYKKDNLGSVIDGCDYFALFYETDLTRPQAGDIGHALHLRQFVFTLLKDIQNLDIQWIDGIYQLQNTCNKIPYRKVKKQGCGVVFDVENSNFMEKEK